MLQTNFIYPFFLECTQYTTDDFWETVFEDLANGTVPNGTYINKGYLCCSYRGKEFSYKLERKDSRVLFNEVHALLSDRLGIYSPLEKIEKKNIFNQTEDEIKNSRKVWTGIRKKNIKDVLYERFVLDMQKKYKLTVKQTKYLLAVIMLSFMFKTLTSKDIVFEHNRIQSVKGIEFEEGKIVVKTSVCATNMFPQTQCSSSAKKMSDSWIKYKKALSKKRTGSIGEEGDIDCIVEECTDTVEELFC